MAQTVWFFALILSVCCEGLGRRYLPFIPAPAFYFLKDLVLLVGFLMFRPGPEVKRIVRQLYKGFGVLWIVGLAWTVAEVFNPDHQSLPLGLIGLRSYWVWWFAPAIVASALRDHRVRERAIFGLVILAIGVSALAAVQFASPADSSVNMYAVWNGEEVYAADTATVASTGRARVSSTFTFLSGFVAFTVLVPALLLSLGLDSRTRRARTAAMIGTFVTASVLPMSGSRGAVVEGAAVLLIAMWAGGLFFTRAGRRVLIASVVTAVLTVVAFPEAVLGVQSRFENTDETTGRFVEVAQVLPPVALATFEYPAIGIGTGMQQNARATFQIRTEWDVESEIGRYLVELGPFGFLLIWGAKLGLMVALFRGYRLLKRAGRRGSSAAALSFSGLTMFGNTTFDHNWQALFFLGCGFILAEIVSVQQAAALQQKNLAEAKPSGELAPVAA
jgi:hypothetical protein